MVERQSGEAKSPFDGVLPHYEIGEKLGILDLEAGRNVSGRGFIVLRGDGALLNRALINLMIDLHVDQGYEELVVPYLVHTDSMTGTGQLPKMVDDMYRATDDMWLIPTAEVPITNVHRGPAGEPRKSAPQIHCVQPLLPPRGRRTRGRHARGCCACTSSTR